MSTRPTPFLRALLVAALVWAGGGPLAAQYELKSPELNPLFKSGSGTAGTVPGNVPVDPDGTPAVSSGKPQFAGVGSTASVAGPRANSADLTARYPSSTGGSAPALVLQRAHLGNAFAAGVPRYLLGDVVTPPATQIDGTTPADALYWRPYPVLPGEDFTHSTGSPEIDVVPADAIPGVYYSPHAERVFAHQAGRVSVTWVTRVEVARAGDPNPGLRYRHKTETFSVSSATTRPVRTIFWTERSFNGPYVNIPSGSIETVNPVYNNLFPANVAAEYVPVGISQNQNPNASGPAETRTFWFEKLNGIGQLRAYNIEGRVFVEYLGALKPGSDDTHHFLGADIVEVVRVAPANNVTVKLGERITPRDNFNNLLPLDGGAEWLASPLLDAVPDPQPYYSSHARADGTLVHYAERENENPDRVVFYWLEKADAAIHFLPAPSRPDLGIHWPVMKNHYVQVWPSGVADYAHYTVATGGSTPATGVQFPGGILPQIVYQDDGAQTQTTLDYTAQRLVVSLGEDGLNRTLLKFSSGSEVWYVRLYTQAEDSGGFLEGDGATALAANVSVGDRVPSPAGYLKAGYIASGSGYHPGAYRDPFSVGALAAEQGAIIPVNAIPGQNQLTVWWFKRIAPPSAAFSAFYVPAKIGRYTVGYPASPAKIVLASNSGSGDLSGVQLAGSLYVQNDRAQVGFNPNEEHALMLGGRIYALRDDLNKVSADAATYTSRPFALLDYTSAEDGRPAMKAFEIVREIDLPGTVNDVRFDYPITAGTILQGPMPLPLMPLPVLPDGRVANTEILGIPDSAHQGPALYDRYTFKDRKGYDWVYRGAHDPSVAALSSPLPDANFNVAGDRGVWTGSNDIGSISISGGLFNAVSTGAGDAALIAPVVNFPGDSVPTVVVRLRASANATVELRWSNATTGGHAVAAAYTGDGDWQTLRFPTSSSPAWAGQTITYIQIDPAVVPGVTFSIDWIGTPSNSLGMQFYYTMREGFFIPGLATQPAVGTVLPYLRPLVGGAPVGDAVSGAPLTINYRPVWPAQAPELRVGETLTLPKFGLPQVLGQASANVLYQQSVAVDGGAKPSVVLHDPIREKVYALGAPGGLSALPASLRTTTSSGKTYFQGLPPHLQERFYFDPMRGAKGSLVFKGAFVNAIAGEDYLNLNVLGDDDLARLDSLVTGADAGPWSSAVAGLVTQVETFVEDPLKAGAFKVGSTVTRHAFELTPVTDSDTAVVDYALTATGEGSGWVTMIFGNGRAFTPAGDPVAVQVFKVAPQLYTGDLKANLSLNPLDEQVTLRHSGDFAARPDDYEFEWRYAIPQDGSAPPTYTYAITERSTADWQLAINPGAFLPEGGYGETVTLPRTLDINAHGAPSSSDFPGTVLRAIDDIDFTVVPARIVFSADLGDYTGFVLYVNGIPAVAYNAPSLFPASAASTGLAEGALSRQFSVDRSYFVSGSNELEVALYSTADLGASTTVNFKLHASTETDLVDAVGTPWLQPTGTLLNEIVVGGDPAGPLGSPLLVMADNYFTLRYRPKQNDNVAGTDWSRWMEPVLVEGWIKRVLAAINPFNQRMSDLANNAVNTDVSLLTSAGKRWEGDVALTLDNIDDVGLIEIYETVLNRGKTISIDAGYDAPAVNDALLLAAGYLNDLYTILGNEAFADAANPTISIDDATSGQTAAGGVTVTEVNTSRFSFEAQVASVLDEELALLRGRDDFASPSVTTGPAYNRLYWNYTRGINSGEALYAVNYNIREKAGSPAADGKLDAADAQRMFPQGHGDAYGHYLTALTGYYKLLQNEHFTWTPRSEAVTILGQAVQIDYQDERKFAAAAANVARTAEQVLSLTHRAVYQDDPAAGWSHYRDGEVNSRTGNTRQWSLDEWAARSTQGAYFHWIVANSLLPEEDIDPTHSGVELIDRTTVPELAELVTTATSFQTTMDNANARLNPLGLSPGAIAFDISPSELQAGKTHYEQIHERALRAVLNAKGSFDQAAKMTRLLRNQENQLDDYNAAIEDQERAYVKRLLEIYGSPYTGDIGAGKTYAQDYAGPDLLNWFVIDRPTDLVDTVKPVTVSVRVPVGVSTFTGQAGNDILNSYLDHYETGETATRTFTIQPDRFVQYADLWPAGGPALGQRRQVGAIQQSLLDVHQAHLALIAAHAALADRQALFLRRHEVYMDQLSTHLSSVNAESDSFAEIRRLRVAQGSLIAAGNLLRTLGESQQRTDYHEGLPKMAGLANDFAAPVRGFLVATNSALGYVGIVAGVLATNAGNALATPQVDEQRDLNNLLIKLGADHALLQSSYEFEILYRELLRGHHEFAALATNLQRASERVRTVVAEGDRVLADREIFRLRAAALIQGYRTKDLTFRTFRNEALEQYRSLFDLASRYTYLAAKSYDYETGLLGTEAGDAVVAGIVSARSLGDLTGGVPQATTSTLGDSGLAGTMARLQADWSVAKGRLGINNPDPYGTVFSLRRELFRLRDDDVSTTEDTAWRQTLEQHIVSDVLSDSDVAEACRNLRKPDGSAVPGIVIPFRTTIEPGLNFFGLPLAAGDHAYSVTSYATKIHSAGLVLRGYIGMNPYAVGTPGAGTVNSTDPQALSATPYVYLIPTGTDYMLAPPLGDTGAVRSWNVKDQALPLPFNLGATAFNTTQFFNANGTLSEQPWILRKHQAFRAVDDPAFFYNLHSAEFTNTRLVGRSVWNGGWKIVIPANTLLSNEQDGLNRFVASVKDIELFLRTYSHSGN